jgi:hypothetical protein
MSHNTNTINGVEPDREGILQVEGTHAGNTISDVNLAANGNSIALGDWAQMVYDLYCESYQNTTYVQENEAGAEAVKANANYSASWTLKTNGYYWFEAVFKIDALGTGEQMSIQLLDSSDNPLGPRAIYSRRDREITGSTVVGVVHVTSAPMTVHAEFVDLHSSSGLMPDGSNYSQYLEVKYLGA